MEELKPMIRRYLDRTGLKAYELSDLAGIPRSTIYRLLKNQRTITLTTAEKILKAMSLKKDEARETLARMSRKSA